MRPRNLIFAILTLCCATTVHANCRVIDTLDNMHATEMRLMRDVRSALFMSEIRRLIRQANQLNGTIVLTAIGEPAYSRKGASFIRFINNAKSLSGQVSIDDPDTAARYLSRSSVRNSVFAVGEYLPQMRCSMAEIADAPPLAYIAPDEPLIDPELLIEHFQGALSLRNVIYILSISLVILGAGLLSQSRFTLKKPGFVRYKANYTSPFKHGGNIRVGTVTNISKSAATVQVDAETKLEKSQKVSFLLGNAWVPGTVVWVNGQHAGLRFTNAIQRGVLKEIRKSRGTKKAATP